MPVSGHLYRFDEEDIARAPEGMGVYSLHKAGETIYIGKAEGGGGGQDTRALEHRDNRRHIPPRQDGGDARGGQEVRAYERGLTGRVWILPLLMFLLSG